MKTPYCQIIPVFCSMFIPGAPPTLGPVSRPARSGPDSPGRHVGCRPSRTRHGAGTVPVRQRAGPGAPWMAPAAHHPSEVLPPPVEQRNTISHCYWTDGVADTSIGITQNEHLERECTRCTLRQKGRLACTCSENGAGDVHTVSVVWTACDEAERR